MNFGQFAVLTPKALSLTYMIPSDITLEVGQSCLLPVRAKGGKAKIFVGIFLNPCPEPDFACVEIAGVISQLPPFSKYLLDFLRKISQYYLAPFEETLRLVAPGFFWDVQKHTTLWKRLATLEETKIRGEPKPLPYGQVLNEQQENAVQEILNHAYHTTHLLHGITGAGKTEVYLRLAQKILARGKNVLVLVPEIALTPQGAARFRAAFGKDLALLHSGLTSPENQREWLRVILNQCRVVLGVRTAIFAPIHNLGLIVVDEEHDGSYKATQGYPPFHARDAAVLRAKIEGALCVLGSATPSLESFLNTQIDRYHYVSLTAKFHGSAVLNQTIDAREDLPQKSQGIRPSQTPQRSSQMDMQRVVLSPKIYQYLTENKEKNEQSLILINRRGYSNYALCLGCLVPLMCPNCSVSTTLHLGGAQEVCHYCGFQIPRRHTCPSCGHTKFSLRGVGTQFLEDHLKEVLPQIRFSRFDRDIMTSQTRFSNILENFRSGEIDCLIGTQMIAKGHDFPKVTLVVVLYLEDLVFLPDFRAHERAYQLLNQVMGRTGRGKQAGTLVLYSLMGSSHPVIQLALDQKTIPFLERELALRRMAWLPPYTRQILFEYQHKSAPRAIEVLTQFKDQLISFWKEKGIPSQAIRLSGPYPAALERLENHYRLQLCLTCEKNYHPETLCPAAILQDRQFLDIRVDVDPYAFL